VSKVQRCAWAETDPLLQQYHDQEWGVPEHDSRALWELLMLEGFQVAAFKAADVTRLLGNPGIIRSRAKIDATIHGARIFEDMQNRGEDFSRFVWNLSGGKPIRNKTGDVPAKTALSEQISAVLKKRGFKFVGPVIVYAWMQASGMVNDHDRRCFRRKV
jgi:DNA-3-methyladenine glycosylase I